MKSILRIKGIILFGMIALFSMSAQAAIITVTNTNDAGAGSLRQAITTANANPVDADNIEFNIPTSDPNYSAVTGVFTITLATTLPTINSLSVSIDATTQPGNTNPNGPEICLRSTTNLLYGLVFPVSGGIAKGFIINGFQVGILITKYGTFPSGGCMVSDNYLGVNHDGTLAVPNEIGVACYGGVANNTIMNNLVSGNTTAGIGIRSSNTNTIKGNRVGTDRNGMYRIPNYYGVAIDSSAYNIVGGSIVADRNLISGNAYAGVAINTNVSHHNIIKGNYIGTKLNCLLRSDTIANFYGIAINESYSNTIGGSTAADRNIISGNSESGIAILGAAATYNTIKGNYIGTNVTASDSVPNGNGILLSGASFTSIGGSVAGDRNIISGNRLAGIAMAYSGTRFNTIKGNYIGTNVAGTGILSNYTGVYLKSNANSNTIGGSTAGERNIISGNIEMGLCIESADSNLIIGNYIGPDATGVAAMRLSNDTLVQANGLMFNSNAKRNTAGGYTAGERNVISGNRIYGHDIYGNSSYNSTIGNYIGVDATGNVAMPNATGICVDGGSNHNPFINNVISGNMAYGIFIVTTGSYYNELKGNMIGTNAAGTDTVPNQCGILLGGGTKYNTIGGSNAADRNIISGNRFDGILAADTGTMFNNITGNYIGTDITGSSALPNEIGIGFATRPSENNIENNVISGNGHLGIIFYEESNNNTVYSNKIGVAADGSSPLGNGGGGIVISKASKYNLIGGAGKGNFVAFNDTVGIAIIDTNTLYNTLSENVVHSNAMMDIDLFPYGVNTNDAGDADLGSNERMNYPVISTVFLDWYTLITDISGTFDHSSPVGTRLEFFKVGPLNMFGHGGSMTYLGSFVITDPAGIWNYSCTGLTASDAVTAIATDVNGNSSEFAANTGIVVGVKENGRDGAFSAFPNPARENLNISFMLSAPQTVEVRVYSAIGAELSVLQSGEMMAGEHTLTYSLSDLGLSNGVYFISLITDQHILKTSRVMILK